MFQSVLTKPFIMSDLILFFVKYSRSSLVIIICAFCSYTFIQLIKSICNLKISPHCAFRVICGHAQAMKTLSGQMYIFASEAEQRKAMPSYFSSLTINKCIFYFLFHVTFFVLSIGDFTDPHVVLKYCVVF